jgi:cytochrome bd-type quinol oxidase subunit 2
MEPKEMTKESSRVFLKSKIPEILIFTSIAMLALFLLQGLYAYSQMTNTNLQALIDLITFVGAIIIPFFVILGFVGIYLKLRKLADKNIVRLKRNE